MAKFFGTFVRTQPKTLAPLPGKKNPAKPKIAESSPIPEMSSPPAEFKRLKRRRLLTPCHTADCKFTVDADDSRKCGDCKNRYCADCAENSGHVNDKDIWYCTDCHGNHIDSEHERTHSLLTDNSEDDKEATTSRFIDLASAVKGSDEEDSEESSEEDRCVFSSSDESIDVKPDNMLPSDDISDTELPDTKDKSSKELQAELKANNARSKKLVKIIYRRLLEEDPTWMPPKPNVPSTGEMRFGLRYKPTTCIKCNEVRNGWYCSKCKLFL